jgi:glucans biosynthesis protein
LAATRRSALAALLGVASALGAGMDAWAADGGLPKLGAPQPFSFDRLKARAAALAARPFAPPSEPAALLHALDYDAVGSITYRPEATLWKTPPSDTAIRFFHMHRHAVQPVTISVVEQGQAREVLYSESLFDTPADSPARKVSGELGFAGFRAMNPGQPSDWLAYQGASYFRSAAPFNQYGLSARGLAVDTAAPTPEEFPAFTAFWLERDAAKRLVVYALLDGPSVAGAYRIVHTRSPGAGGGTDLAQDVEAVLTFRKPVHRLGIAPLTSMYWYGATDRTPAQDWRPQIHDSDGLSVWTGSGERIWRPLANPPRVITNTFADKTPRGFGLMQRDRRFEDYQDDGIFYDRRPSVWVEPVGDWGEGSVELVEIPTTGEVDDNIVAFWTPAAAPKAGQSQTWRYRLHWASEEPGLFGVARVVATREGRGGRPGQPAPPGRRKFVVDFRGGGLKGLDRRSGIEPVVETRPGHVVDLAAYPVVGTDLWRLTFDLDLAGTPRGGVINLRGFLRKGRAVLTETWVHQVFVT